MIATRTMVADHVVVKVRDGVDEATLRATVVRWGLVIRKRMTAPGMYLLAVRGNELSRHHHCNSLFTDFTTPSRNLEESLKGATAAGGIATLNHPAMHWPRDHAAPTAKVTIPLKTPLREITMGDFTVDAWFRTTDSGRNILFGNFKAGQGNALNLELHTDNRVRIYLEARPGQVVEIREPATPLGIDTRDGAWHHLAGRRVQSELALFLDGRPIGRKSVTVQELQSFELTGDDLYLGRDSREGGTMLNGDLDEVRLWTCGLSDEAIAGLAAGARPETAPMAEVAFETSGGQPLHVGTPMQGQFDVTSTAPTVALSGSAEGHGAVTVVSEVPEPLRDSGQSAFALRFGAVSSVPEAAVHSYITLFEAHPVLFGMEVLNGTRPLREYPLDRALWDALLGAMMPSRPVWGMASDDMHSDAHLGHDWVVILADRFDESTVRGALQAGRFYFSSMRVRPDGSASPDAPPRIVSISHNRELGVVELKAVAGDRPLPEAVYKWVSHGRTVHTGTRFAYRDAATLPEDARYLRAEIYGDGGATYINPFGFAAEGGR